MSRTGRTKQAIVRVNIDTKAEIDKLAAKLELSIPQVLKLAIQTLGDNAQTPTGAQQLQHHYGLTPITGIVRMDET